MEERIMIILKKWWLTKKKKARVIDVEMMKTCLIFHFWLSKRNEETSEWGIENYILIETALNPKQLWERFNEDQKEKNGTKK